jgi:hypothetical protein
MRREDDFFSSRREKGGNMIDQSVITASEFSTEQYQDILAHHWKRLIDIRQTLESELEQDLNVASISNVLACIQETTEILSTLPGYLVLMYIVSRDALQMYLQKASLELRLSRAQFVTKGRSRRYYTSLLACQQYLDKALAQRRDTAWNWQGIEWRLHSSTQTQDHSHTYIPDVSIQQGRQYQIELPSALNALRCLHKLFQEDLEIWPDQCIRAIDLLNDMQKLVHELCDFLDLLVCSQAAISPDYCQTVVILHHIYGQVRSLNTYITGYRLVCRSSSIRSINMKRAISDLLTSIIQYTDEGVYSLTRLLDQAYFQERKANGEQAISHFA